VKKKKKKKKKKEELEKYFQPKNPGSFAGIDKFRRGLEGKQNVEEIKTFLKSKDAYTLHFPVRHRFPRRRIIVSSRDQMWEADLLFMTDLKEANSGWAYILTCIDVLSKFGFCEKLKTKTSAEVTAAFKRILERAKKDLGRQAAYCRTDMGLEFNSRTFRSLMEKYGIRHFATLNTETKASVCERYVL